MNEQTPEIDSIHIEIAYAVPHKQVILDQIITTGLSPREAVIQSPIEEYFPEIDKEKCDIGIFGKLIRPDHKLQPGDRIEIYRALIADPKQVRKNRAAQGLQMKKGGGKE